LMYCYIAVVFSKLHPSGIPQINPELTWLVGVF